MGEKVTGNQQKITSTEKKLMSNEQKVQPKVFLDLSDHESYWYCLSQR